jgi:ferrous iron transport protein A
MANRPYLPLEQLQPGTHGMVRELGGGKSLASRLAAMGLTVGAYIEVLENRGHGPLFVLVRDTRIALGRSEAHNIAQRRP